MSSLDEYRRRDFEIIKIDSAHIEEIAAIEGQVFPEPWSKKSLELLTEESGAGFAVQLPEGQLAGYAGLIIVSEEGQITNIATLPKYRRQGIGAALLAALINHAAERRVKTIFLEVRSSNHPAVELYRKFGFSPCGLRKGFYRHPTENAVVMVKRLAHNQN